MRMMYSRVTVIMEDEVEAAVGTADVLLVNWGYHAASPHAGTRSGP